MNEEKAERLNNEEFDKIFDKIVKSDVKVDIKELVMILATIIRDTEPGSEKVEEFVKDVKEMKVPNIVSHSVLLACNSVLLSLFELHKKEFDEVKLTDA